MNTTRLLSGFVTALALAGASQAQVIGTFEGGSVETGWGYWSSGVQTPYSDNPALTLSTEQATDGVASIKVTNTGYQQTLAYNAGVAGTVQDFVDNDTLSFDVIFTKDISPNGGYQEVTQLFLNSPAGFNDILGGSVQVGWAPNSDPGMSTINVSLDYSAIKTAWDVPNNGNPGYIEMIFATQNQVDGTDNEALYIDNVRLSTVPEPATVGLLSLGALAMIRRR